MGDSCRVQMKKNERASWDVVLWGGVVFNYFFLFLTCVLFHSLFDTSPANVFHALGSDELCV
uniref:Putative ovule protein n=1 Tax=Solanum chacoense TaxID=4108 RepID=A0A0V0GZ11_SOLCH